jgi:N-dimethylarginine dimethylaminohydrolase
MGARDYVREWEGGDGAVTGLRVRGKGRRWAGGTSSTSRPAEIESTKIRLVRLVETGPTPMPLGQRYARCMPRHVLMCEPIHFRVEYEINPWMRRLNAVDRPRALGQWRRLRDVLVDLGVAVELIEQAPDVPDMTFTANAGLVTSHRFLPANFRYRERMPEATHFTFWFEEHGYAVEPIHDPHYWEGEGDVLPVPGASFLLGGYRFRTEVGALDHVEAALGRDIVRVELTDPRFYHLDTCFCPLGNGAALYVPGAFTEPSRTTLGSLFDDLIAVPDDEGLRFACNALVVDDLVVLNTGCTRTEAALQRRGHRPIATPTDEFIKAGGSVKCLVLQLDALAAP